MVEYHQKASSKVVSIVKLSYDVFYLVSGPFLLKKHILLNWTNTPDPFLESRIVRKVYIIVGEIPFQGLQMCLSRTFLWEIELSKSFGSPDRILPKYGPGLRHFGFFANF